MGGIAEIAENHVGRMAENHGRRMAQGGNVQQVTPRQASSRNVIWYNKVK